MTFSYEIMIYLYPYHYLSITVDFHALIEIICNLLNKVYEQSGIYYTVCYKILFENLCHEKKK
jgi:hypothetical protein